MKYIMEILGATLGTMIAVALVYAALTVILIVGLFLII